jgi:hypothetical protein
LQIKGFDVIGKYWLPSVLAAGKKQHLSASLLSLNIGTIIPLCGPGKETHMERPDRQMDLFRNRIREVLLDADVARLRNTRLAEVLISTAVDLLNCDVGAEDRENAIRFCHKLVERCNRPALSKSALLPMVDLWGTMETEAAELSTA